MEYTTDWVVAFPTPSAPGSQVIPLSHPTKATIIPNITEDTIIVPKVIATVLLSSAGKTKKCKCK